MQLTPAGLAYDGVHLAYTSDITRNFNAEEYRKVGYQKAISPSDDGYEINKEEGVFIQKQISKNTINYYSNDWLDTSAISLIDFGKTFENYQVEKEISRVAPRGSLPDGRVEYSYTQSRAIYTESWAIDSLDVVLGLVGGFTGLLWAALSVLLGGYENFKLENSLIGAVYPTSPTDDGVDG